MKPHPQTATPAFRRWFGASKVVDAAGQPLVVYHGTGKAFDTFDPARLGEQTGAGNTAMGFFFAEDYDLARELYAGKRGEVMEVYLSIQKPLRIRDAWDNDMGAALRIAARDYLDRDPETAEDWWAFRDYLRDLRGIDGVEFVGYAGDPKYEQRVYLAFEPTQIKSATGNVGTFDPKDPNILRNPRVRRRKNSSDDDDADFASYNDLGEDDLGQDAFDARYWNNELQRLCERLDYSLMQSGEDVGRRLDRYGGRGYHDTSPERAALIKREGLGNHPGLTYHGGGGIEGHESPFWMCAWAHPDVAARLLKRGRENGWRDWVEHEVADALSKHLAQRYPNLKAVWFYETKAGGGISKYAGARCSFDLRKVVEWLSANAEDGPYLYNGHDTGWCLSWDGPRIPPKFLRWTRQNPR
jgi:hypothetical protein